MSKWGPMYLRSQARVEIARELTEAGVVFFANARGLCNFGATPVAATELNSRLEVDFFVFQGDRVILLEIDSGVHSNRGAAARDRACDREASPKENRTIPASTTLGLNGSTSSCRSESDSVMLSFVTVYG